jgi:CheY-like chemotaxis protein
LSTTEGEAWTNVQNEHPDAILVDLRLRDSSGLELIERMRLDLPETQQNTNVCRIGWEEARMTRKMHGRSGQTGFIRKPISLEQLSLDRQSQKWKWQTSLNLA